MDIEKDGACKMDRQNKKCSCARKSGRKKNNAELIKKRKRNWLGNWLKRNCLLKNDLEGMVNGKKVRGRGRYQMISRLHEDTKSKAEKRVEWRILSLLWKSCPWAELYDWVLDMVPLQTSIQQPLEPRGVLISFIPSRLFAHFMLGGLISHIPILMLLQCICHDSNLTGLGAAPSTQLHT